MRSKNIYDEEFATFVKKFRRETGRWKSQKAWWQGIKTPPEGGIQMFLGCYLAADFQLATACEIPIRRINQLPEVKTRRNLR